MNSNRFSRALVARIAGAVMMVSLHTASYSQPQRVNWTIQKINEEWVTNCFLDSLSGKTLWFHQYGLAKSVAMDSVAIIWSPCRSHGAVGALIGVVTGALAGYLLTPEKRTKHSWLGDYNPAAGSALGGGVVGGVLGYAIGSQLGGETVYDLREMNLPVKISTVWSILRGVN